MHALAWWPLFSNTTGKKRSGAFAWRWLAIACRPMCASVTLCLNLAVTFHRRDLEFLAELISHAVLPRDQCSRLLLLVACLLVTISIGPAP
jgi:hypothetical protein